MAVSRQWQLMRSFLRKTHNRSVNEFFRDLPENVELDNTTGRKAAKYACLIKPEDSQGIAQIKLITFEKYVAKLDKLANVYSIPKPDFDQGFKYRPQVTLYYYQDSASVPVGQSRVQAETSFRLINETSETLTNAEVNRIASKIKANFATGNGFRWSKGKVKVCYRDLANGYDLRILALSEAEGIDVIRQVLKIQDHTYDSDFVINATPKKTFPATPPKQMVLGRLRSVPRQRPTAIVRFTHATLSVWGMPNDIVLVGSQYAHANPIETY